LGHCEYDVKVLHQQQFILTRLQPLCTYQRLALWAVAVAAAVECDALVGTVITLLNVPAQGRRAAALDGAHHPALPLTQDVGMEMCCEQQLHHSSGGFVTPVAVDDCRASRVQLPRKRFSSTGSSAYRARISTNAASQALCRARQAKDTLHYVK